MHSFHKSALWSQFGAAIRMLENAMDACPDALWGDRARQPEFWYLVFHTVFFLDYYLADSEADFAPPAPFTLDELDPTGVMPERVYTKSELKAYLAYARARCRRVLEEMTEDRARARCGFTRMKMSVWELMLDNLRHVQHHAAQLNLMLRQQTDSAPLWVSAAPDPLS